MIGAGDAHDSTQEHDVGPSSIMGGYVFFLPKNENTASQEAAVKQNIEEKKKVRKIERNVDEENESYAACSVKRSLEQSSALAKRGRNVVAADI